MDTMQAFLKGQVARAANSPMKAFDWEKAAELILKHSIKNASAGLAEDWEWTGDQILKDGNPNFDAEVYLASCWATPTLRTDKLGDVECFHLFEGTNPSEVWPEKALQILSHIEEKTMGKIIPTIVVNIADLYAKTEVAKLAHLDEYITIAKNQAGLGNQIVLTGPGPVWLYLAVAHALHGLATTLRYNSPATGDVMIFDHNPH